ncbi:MAG TPA: class I SAM-dependent methyltransferase [Thermoanaerobaculia bacterium]|nr:class I SAM-dependent methyltransferase [Thermoanaerobaculia bacterium]
MTASTRPGVARRLYRGAVRGTVETLCRLGWNVARSRDYYSPLPVFSALARHRARWDRPSALGGVRFDLDSMRERVLRLLSEHGEEYGALPAYDALKARGYGPGFTLLDGMFLYLVLRSQKPRRFVEVGSGLSTCYASLAIAANAREGAPGAITCIDPNVGGGVRALECVEVVPREVQDVAPAFFAELERGDVLFIDSTHVVRLDGDVPHLYLEVVPALAPGVVVHAHDVHFPYNIPFPAEQYVMGRTWPTLWTEAMLVQAFLAFNSSFQVILSLPLLRHHDEDFLRRSIPGYRPVEPSDYDTHFGSLWFERALQPYSR